MIQEKESVEFIVPDAVYRQIIELSLQQVDGLVQVREKDISICRNAGNLKAVIHISGFLGSNLEALALSVQKQAAAALQQMAAPDSLYVQVIVDDIVVKSHN